MFSVVSFLKSLLISNEVDRTKQLEIQVSSGATTGTKTTLVASQTSNRTITLPDSNLDFNTIVTAASSTVLTNKSIDGDDNTVSDLALTSLKTNLSDASKFVVRDASGIVVSNSKDVPAGTVVGTTDSQALTNKTIVPASNSISLSSANVLVGNVSNVAAPVAITGDISLSNAGLTAYSGTVPINKGGTGQVTASAALTALLPSQGGHSGDFLTSNGTTASWGAVPSTPVGFSARNYLINSDFGIQQRNTNFTMTNGQTKFTADRWYATNAMGGGTLTATVQPGSLSQSTGSIEVFASSGFSSSTGARLSYTLETADAQALFNQNISFSCQIQAAGNINQIKLQFLTETTNNLAQTNLGASATVSVNSGGYTLCKLENIAVGNLSTPNVVGIQITATGASSGTAGDSGNGFIIEQAMLNIGATAAPWQRQAPTVAEELIKCQRYWEKSYPQGVLPAAVGYAGAVQYNAQGTNPIFTTVPYLVNKRDYATSTVTIYDAVTGATGTAGDRTNGTSHQTINTHDLGERSFIADQSTVVSNHQYAFHFVVDNEMSF